MSKYLVFKKSRKSAIKKKSEIYNFVLVCYGETFEFYSSSGYVTS